MKRGSSPVPTDARPGLAHGPTLAEWLRHQVTALIATAADYVVMVGGVEVVHLRPVPATAAGALVGALVSLTLGLRYTYRLAAGPLTPYAFRYALVSAGSLGWNAGGVAFFHHNLGLQYVLARVVTSVLVSNAWNYPMQRFFVFSLPGAPAPEPHP